MDSISETRLQPLYPPLAVCARKMDEMLETRGILIRIIQGLRTWPEQDGFFAKGRTVKSDIPCRHNGVARSVGTCQQHPLGATVTNCRGGHSYHNFALAFDAAPSQFTPDKPYSPDWNSSHETWKEMEECGKSLGLEIGATWRTFPDAPHFQMNGPFPIGSPNDEVRQLFQADGLQAVWAAVTQGMQ